VVYCNPVGIEETENVLTDFFIYPNPVSNTLHVQLDNLQRAQIKILTVWGGELLQETIYSGDNAIDLAEIKDGIYFVTIISGERQLNNRKLIVLKK
jgi:hypothetical protein